MPLPTQALPIPLRGLRGDVASKLAPAGVLELAENCYAVKTTEGGIELRKRNGFTGYGTTIDGGGSIAAGSQLAVLGDEMVLTDGKLLYTYNSTGSEWVKKGKLTDVSAVASNVVGNAAPVGGAVSSDPIQTDVAYLNGYAFFVVSRADAVAKAEWYVQQVATGAIVASGSLPSGVGATRARVVAQGTLFFAFYADGTSTLRVRTWDTSTPGSGLNSPSTVTTSMATSGIYDVIADATNTSRVYVAFRNTTPTLTILQWNTNGTATTTATYASVAPVALGFLQHTFSNSTGYLAVGDASDVRVLTFETSDLVVDDNTQVDATATCTTCTGYFSTVKNVFWTSAGSSRSRDLIKGWSNGTGFTVMRGLMLASRAFVVNSKCYFMAAYEQEDTAGTNQQNSLFLLEVDYDATGAAGCTSIAGYLIAGRAAQRQSNYQLGAIAAVSASEYVASFGHGEDIVRTSSGTIVARHYSLKKFSLVFGATGGSSLLGVPVQFAGVLHYPGAVSKTYDGRQVVESGFMLYPKAPTTSTGTTGSMAAGTYQYCDVYAWTDAAGRVRRSAPSMPVSVTLAAPNDEVALTSETLRITEASPTYNLNAAVVGVRIEHYRTKANGSTFFYLGSSTNDAGSDTVAYPDTVADSAIEGNPTLYTDVEVDHITPPMITALEVHRSRLFASTGDAASGLWFTNELREGIAAEFSDSLRVPLAVRSLATASLDGSLAIMERNRIYVLTGDGPNLDGSNPYSYPTPLPAEDGPLHARAWVRTPDGIMIKSAKGWRLLDRSGGLQAIPGADAYDSLTITGGVTLDDQSFAVFSTAADGCLVWDWENKLWYAWDASNGVADGVACARWNNQLVLLVADGTVRRQVAGSYSDGTDITMRVRTKWLNLAALLGRFRLKGVHIPTDNMASFTLSTALTYDHDTTVVQTATKAVTTATVLPVAIQPTRERCTALQVTVSETSTTEGFRLPGIALEVGVKPGAYKAPVSAFAT